MFYIAICDDEDYFCRKEKKIIEKYMMQRECKVKIELFSWGKNCYRIKTVYLSMALYFLILVWKNLMGWKQRNI